MCVEIGRECFTHHMKLLFQVIQNQDLCMLKHSLSESHPKPLSRDSIGLGVKCAKSFDPRSTYGSWAWSSPVELRSEPRCAYALVNTGRPQLSSVSHKEVAYPCKMHTVANWVVEFYSKVLLNSLVSFCLVDTCI